MSQKNSIHETWNRIEAWADKNFPELLTTLSDGASESQLNQLTELLVHPLPSNISASFIRHNGQHSHPALFWYKDVYQLMSVEAIIEELEYRIKFGNGIKKTSAIPIATAGSGDKIWLKLNPDGEGPLRLRSYDDPAVPDLHPSFTAWLNEFTTDLEAGRYCVGEYNSLDRTFPNKEERNKLIEQIIDRVAKMGGDVEVVIDDLSKATNQPKWIVTYYISPYRLQSDLEDRKYDIKGELFPKIRNKN